VADAEYTLYGFAQSGNCYKVALCLELAGAAWKARFVDYFNGETHTPAYRAINAMGEAPVLEHGALRLSQSGVILDYLADQYPQFAADNHSDDPSARREALRWLLWDNHKLTSYTATYRYFRVLAPTAEPAVVAEFGKRARAAWTILDTHLGGGRSFVVGSRLSIVDLSICGYLFFEDELGVDWNEFPNLRDWLERIKAQPRWRHPYDLLPGHPLPARPPRP
jgi:glutathione S-transferase